MNVICGDQRRPATSAGAEQHAVKGASVNGVRRMELNQLARQGWLLLMTSVSRLLYPVTSLSKAPLLTSANEIAHLILWFKPGQVTEIKKINQPRCNV